MLLPGFWIWLSLIHAPGTSSGCEYWVCPDFRSGWKPRARHLISSPQRFTVCCTSSKATRQKKWMGWILLWFLFGWEISDQQRAPDPMNTAPYLWERWDEFRSALRRFKNCVMILIFSRDSMIWMLSTCFPLRFLDHEVTLFQSYSILLTFQVSNLLQYLLSKGCGSPSYVLVASGSSPELLCDFRGNKISQWWLKVVKSRKKSTIFFSFFFF